MDLDLAQAVAVAVAIISNVFWLRWASIKNSTIESLRTQLDQARASSPFVMMETLDKRISIQERELQRLQQDATANEAAIVTRERDLDALRGDMNQLRKIADELFCDMCGAPMQQRSVEYHLAQYDEGELDVEEEVEEEEAVYMCGRVTLNGAEMQPCGNLRPPEPY